MDTPIRGVHIPNFGQILVKKIQFWGPIPLLLPYCPLLHAKFHPNRCNVSHVRGEKPQNGPLSNFNTGALLCAQCCR